MLTPDQTARQRHLFEQAFPVAKDSPLLEGTDAYECGDVDMRWRAWVACYVANGMLDGSTDSLTEMKTRDIEQRGFKRVGYVLADENGEVCIVDRSAVKWLTSGEHWKLMHGEGCSFESAMLNGQRNYQGSGRYLCGVCKLPASAVRPNGTVTRQMTCRCAERGHP